MITAIGWLGTLGVLAAYASRKPRLFAQANALLCVAVAAPAIAAGVYSAAAISLTFGAIGLWTLIKGTN